MCPRLLIGLLLGLLIPACASEAEQPAQLPQGDDRVELDPADFTTRIDNPYWPMAPRSRWVYREGRERVVVTVTDLIRTVDGVDARVIHDVVSRRGKQVE